MMNPPLVETRELSVHFGGLQAVNNVNFSLRDGELRCLIGPNGAGKTTFFRLLTGVHAPTSGTVAVNGRSIAGLQTHQIARLGVGIKTQIPSLFDNLSVRENIWLSARRNHSRAAANRIADSVIMDEVGLGEYANTETAKLSHGLRQWVELGVVIAQRPKLILLDEPAAGMTGHDMEKTAELIKRINRTSAMIVVEHDMEFIKRIAKTVTVFNRGEVLVESDVDTVLADERVREVYLGKQTGRQHDTGA
ncbi:ATP-binding cassette domain-containing protein [Bradyrhizobium uaiense]|uniref:ATP-binding cassette domain-containing protein n=1 Tax=Bradyrhizobium uaiense TaxID=2594946 RepID=A0A6P1BNM9_9BRAD|nr:ATP-binding cassette domain-containing protein [Bradyrhizobium uaiense]NEU99192.1 ATP-binding cassette domain-containing protein [Bradyrhizobium uaiense]